MVRLFIVALFAFFAARDLSCLAEEGVCENTDGKQCADKPTPSPSAVPAAVKIAKGSNEQGRPPDVSFSQCVDRNDACVGYANSGECTKNPGWMIVNCPHSCNACHLRDYKARCDRNFLNISTDPIYHPGDMNKMFSTIKERFGDRYDVTVLSESPWVVTLDNFLTDDEAAALISTVEGTWERSTDTGSANAFGETGRTLSKGRTSSNAWCRANCLANQHVQSAIAKIEDVTYIPQSHYESFQILQYDVGQFYNNHHDMGLRQKLLSCGPRILTFFLYLSDVEEGGETVFTNLDMKVKPKKGRALIWPSVMDADPEAQDPRTHHAAAPVIKGKKYAANAWIHLYDFTKSNLWGCTGAFDYL